MNYIRYCDCESCRVLGLRSNGGGERIYYFDNDGEWVEIKQMAHINEYDGVSVTVKCVGNGKYSLPTSLVRDLPSGCPSVKIAAFISSCIGFNPDVYKSTFIEGVMLFITRENLILSQLPKEGRYGYALIKKDGEYLKYFTTPKGKSMTIDPFSIKLIRCYTAKSGDMLKF